MNMKCLKLISPGKLKFFNNEKKPEIDEDSLLIKVKYCGICSSDIKFIEKGHRINKYPMILGHEVSGIVHKIGKKVKKFKLKDHIVLGAEIPCDNQNKCLNCLNNKPLYCQKFISLGTTINGGFADYIVVNKNFLNTGPIIKVNNKIDYKYSCLAESFACVINGIESINLKRVNSVLIIGSGYMGLLFIILLKKLYKIKKIDIIDTNKERLILAKKIGVDNFFNISVNNKNISKILKVNNREKYDYVISANNNITCHKASLKLVNKGGFINLFGGIPKNTNDKILISSNFIHYNQIFIGGSFSSNIKHLKKSINFITNYKLIVKKLISNIVGLGEAKKFMKKIKKNQAIKVLIKL